MAIGDYIAKDSPRRALAFILKLEEKALQITHTPLGYLLIPRYEHAAAPQSPRAGGPAIF